MDIILCPSWDERRLSSMPQEAPRASLSPILSSQRGQAPFLRAGARSDWKTYPSSADGQFTGERTTIKNKGHQIQEQLEPGSTSEMVPTGKVQ